MAGALDDDDSRHAEMDELRARLAEAESTLHALREGHVDAIVVGERIFTLEGADAVSNRLRGDALAQMEDAVVATDLDEHVIYMNLAAERLHGRTASDMLGRPLEELYTRRWLTEADAAEARVASAARTTWRGPVLHRRPDGSQVRTESVQSALRDAEGDVTGTLFVFRDVGERMRELSLRLALVTLGERIRDLDDPGELAYASAEILGTELGVDRAGYGFFDRAAQTVSVRREWNAPGTEPLPIVLAAADHTGGVERLLRHEAVVVADALEASDTVGNAEALVRIGARALVNLPVARNGKVVGLLYLHHAQPRTWTEQELRFVHDVADRAGAAMDRREAQQQLEVLAHSLEAQVAERTQERDKTWSLSQDLLGVCDAAGVFLSTNPAWEATLGWQADDLRATPFADLVHPDDLASTEAALARLTTGTDVARVESRLRHVDGDYRDIDWTLVAEGARFYTMGRDVTADKRRAAELDAIQSQLRQSQKLEAVGQLTGGIAHDFNNLLQVVSGNLHLMQRQGADPQKLQQRIEAARAAVQRGAQLSKQLLAFSRQQALQPQVIDIGALVHGMTDMLQRSLGEGIEIDIRAEPGLWPTFVDPAQVENAVLNLCINARDAMEAQGRLSIALANATLDATGSAGESDARPGDYVMLAVTDTGSGMSPEVLAKAFEPFFTTKPVGSGSGLGLSMVYGFVKQSDGHARIDSEVGRGTSIELYLPRSWGEDAAPVQQADAVEHGGSETVLVVEDDHAVLVTAVDLLGELGYTVLTARDAASALAMIEAGARIDLLFTDVVMPGPLSSPALVEKAQSLLPGLAVLYTSGYPQNAIVHGGRLDAGVELLPKPYDRGELAKKLRAVLATAAKRP